VRDFRRLLYRDYSPGREAPADGLAAARLFARKQLGPALRGVKGPILELGAGRGFTLRALAELGFAEVRGVDASPSQVALAHADGIAVEELDGRLALERAAPGSLGAVIALDLFEHLDRDELVAWTRLCAERLRPDGRLAFRAPNGEGLFGGAIRWGDLTHEQALTPSSVRQLLDAAGLEPLSIEPCRPLVHGPVSAARGLLWRGVELALTVANAAETGRLRGALFTRNLFVSARPRPR